MLAEMFAAIIMYEACNMLDLPGEMSTSKYADLAECPITCAHVLMPVRMFHTIRGDYMPATSTPAMKQSMDVCAQHHAGTMSAILAAMPPAN